MQHYLCKLLPPRPTFAQDMSEQEMAAMHAHVGYWSKLAEEGTALLFGPVADPQGVWGVGVIAVRDETVLDTIQADDPAIKADIGLRYEAFPMPQLMVGKLR